MCWFPFVWKSASEESGAQPSSRFGLCVGRQNHGCSTLWFIDTVAIVYSWVISFRLFRWIVWLCGVCLIKRSYCSSVELLRAPEKEVSMQLNCKYDCVHSCCPHIVCSCVKLWRNIIFRRRNCRLWWCPVMVSISWVTFPRNGLVLWCLFIRLLLVISLNPPLYCSLFAMHRIKIKHISRSENFH